MSIIEEENRLDKYLSNLYFPEHNLDFEQLSFYTELCQLQAFAYESNYTNGKVSLFVTGVDFIRKTVELERISIKKEFQKQGIASTLIEKLKILCRTHKFRLVVMPSEDFGTNIDVLNRFYEKLGFSPPSIPLDMNDPFCKYMWVI